MGCALPRGGEGLLTLAAVTGHKQELCFQLSFTQLMTYSETSVCGIFEHQCQNDSWNVHLRKCSVNPCWSSEDE